MNRSSGAVAGVTSTRGFSVESRARTMISPADPPALNDMAALPPAKVASRAPAAMRNVASRPPVAHATLGSLPDATSTSAPTRSDPYGAAKLSPSDTLSPAPTVPPSRENCIVGRGSMSTLNLNSGTLIGVMSISHGSAVNRACTEISPAVTPLWNGSDVEPPGNTAARCPAGIVNCAVRPPVAQATAAAPCADPRKSSVRVPAISTGYEVAKLSPSGMSCTALTAPPCREYRTGGMAGTSSDSGKIASPIVSVPVSLPRAVRAGESWTTNSSRGPRVAGRLGRTAKVNGPVILAASTD